MTLIQQLKLFVKKFGNQLLKVALVGLIDGIACLKTVEIIYIKKKTYHFVGVKTKSIFKRESLKLTKYGKNISKIRRSSFHLAHPVF